MFSYKYYTKMVNTLLRCEYSIGNYHFPASEKKFVILRHDVDFDLEKAARFAVFESELGIKSTYFVLLTSNFYNIFSNQAREYLAQIIESGHSIGLHFDEMQYDIGDSQNAFECAVKNELEVFQGVLGQKIDCVSMHRPSKFALETDFDFGKDVVNSYSETFFKKYKYLSDSHMSWKEDAIKVIEGDKYPKLHILTHPIWYHESDEEIKEIIENFFAKREEQLYEDFEQNFTDFKEIFSKVKVE